MFSQYLHWQVSRSVLRVCPTQKGLYLQNVMKLTFSFGFSDWNLKYKCVRVSFKIIRCLTTLPLLTTFFFASCNLWNINSEKKIFHNLRWWMISIRFQCLLFPIESNVSLEHWSKSISLSPYVTPCVDTVERRPSTSFPQADLSRATLSISLHDFLMSFASAITDLLQVILGLPRFLWPYGFHLWVPCEGLSCCARGWSS